MSLPNAWDGGIGARDAHNTYLSVILAVGLVGAIPFLVGWGSCIRAAWRARRGDLGLVPLAIGVGLLVESIGGTILTWKPFWLFLALCWATVPFAGPPKRFAVRLVRRPFENKMNSMFPMRRSNGPLT